MSVRFDSKAEEIAIRLSKINILIDSNTIPLAKQLCFDAIKEFPEEPEFYALLGLIWQWHEKRNIDGEAAHLKSVELAPENAGYYLNKLYLLNLIRYPDDDVEKVIHHCLSLHNIDKVRVLGEWALWLEYNGRFEEALAKNKERYMLLPSLQDLKRIEDNIARIKEKIRITNSI